MAKKLYIIDGHSFAYRAFYALPPMTAKGGMEVHAVFGFYRMLDRLMTEKKPDYLALTFDSPKPTFRHKAYADYKAQREVMPESLQEQMKIIKSIARKAKIQVYEEDGYEADDIIASAASVSSDEGVDTVILTGDKDIIQLINSSVSVLKFGKSGETILTPSVVKEQYGIKPEQIVDVLALMGDSSDNIPGVKGIGEKTAYKLVAEYGNTETIIRSLDKVKPERVKKLLQAGLDNLKISRELALLKPEKTLIKKTGFSVAGCSLSLIDEESLEAAFIEYDFKSLVKSKEKVTEKVRADGKIENTDSLAWINKKNGGAVTFIFAGEEKPEIVLVSDRDKNVYMQVPELKGLEEINAELIVTNNSKELYKRGIPAGSRIDDIALMAYLLNPEKKYSDVSHIFTEYAGGTYLSFSDVAGKGAKKVMFSLADPAEVRKYAVSMLSAAPKLAVMLEKKLKDEELYGVYSEMEMPVSRVLAGMENTGVNIDSESLDKLLLKTEKEINRIEKSVFKESGEEFNINSPKQLSGILFEKLGLPKQKRTKTGYSTNNEVLKILEPMHPVVPAILKYRTLVKLKTGFLDVLKKSTKKDGRVYPEYNQAVTATGRLSASNPNIQNIPVRGEEGKEIRGIFIPMSKGENILKADYSQVELRVLAHVSGDEKLTEAFSENRDIHSITAAEIFETDMGKVTQDQRRVAKTINFGIIYGMSPYGLAKELGISNPEAGVYIDRFFMTFPGVKKYQEETIECARSKGFVKTIFGRKRYVGNINSSNRTIREFAERAAINAPIQGAAADIIKQAMITIDQFLDKNKMASKMILQVHDELVFSVPENESEQMKKKVRELMEGAAQLRVPLSVAIGEGRNWNECG